MGSRTMNRAASLSLVIIVANLVGGERPVAAADFALRDGDTVVFLGDSITAARTYTKIIENYTLLRFPERRIRYFNAGIGGDTAAGALARLERDVFSCNPTVLTVCFGLNDIGWGLRADDEHKARYIESLKQIIAACRERKIRVFICSSPVTAEDPDKSEKGFLQAMCDEAFAMARQERRGNNRRPAAHARCSAARLRREQGHLRSGEAHPAPRCRRSPPE